MLVSLQLMAAGVSFMQRDAGDTMPSNRSMPASTVIPELGYPDVTEAARWLRDAFGFETRLTIGHHRAQLRVGDGAVVLTRFAAGTPVRTGDAARPFAVMVRVGDVDAHHRRAARHGAEILSEPRTYPYGERQYSCRDPGGNVWTFSQSVADVAPEDWGGVIAP
jgi:uncharacterized glyoxalase superfamily protein PhnB